MAYIRSYLGEDGLGQMPTGAQIGIKAGSMALNYVPVVGNILSGIASLFGGLFGGGEPSRHQKSQAAIDAAGKYMPRNPEDLVKKIEQFIKSTEKCKMPLFGGTDRGPVEGRAQYVAACITAGKLGLEGFKAGKVCSPYNENFCYDLKKMRGFFIGILPKLKAELSKSSQASIVPGITNWMPLLIVGSGVYLLSRR